MLANSDLPINDSLLSRVHGRTDPHRQTRITCVKPTGVALAYSSKQPAFFVIALKGFRED